MSVVGGLMVLKVIVTCIAIVFDLIFFNQKTAYELYQCDWSSDVCSSDLPHAIENPFYLLAPKWAHYPLVLFATLATIIASLAIISVAHPLTQPTIQLAFLAAL